MSLKKKFYIKVFLQLLVQYCVQDDSAVFVALYQGFDF